MKAEKVEKKAIKTKAKATAVKKKAVTRATKAAGKTEQKTPSQKPAAKEPAAEKAEVIIQSPIGGEITLEEIRTRVGEVDTVYIRVDQNKAYWVKGSEYGAVDLW